VVERGGGERNSHASVRGRECHFTLDPLDRAAAYADHLRRLEDAVAFVKSLADSFLDFVTDSRTTELSTLFTITVQTGDDPAANDLSLKLGKHARHLDVF
jgi:hypothetical protein